MSAPPVRTDSLDAAAFLVVRGHRVLDADRTSGLTVFSFGLEASDDLAEFYKDAMVSARAMGAALRQLKRLIPRTGEVTR